MTVLALPDATGAMIARVGSFSEVVALTGTRVSTKLQPGMAKPAYAVTLHKSGGPGPDEYGPLFRQRYDLKAYGPDARTADLLWRTLHACLCPMDGRARQFVAAGTRVYSVDQQGGPLALVDPDTHWPYTFAPYIVTYSVVPA